MAKFEYMNNDSNSSLRGRVFSHLENNILNGKYKTGESLIETKLSEELGVSRTPIREAIRQLELEGLVQTIPNKGAIVTGLSAKDIDDIYTIRLSIEGLAARWAAENITEVELDNMKHFLELEEFYTAKNDIEHILKLDTKFHETIFRASKSRPLMNMLRNFHHYIQKARIFSLGMEGRAEEALSEHEAIYQAISQKDAKKAEELTIEHVKKASLNLLKGEVVNDGV
ncbi:MAG: GntR family transcriptional regulator [Clostridiaceae bacterium]|jgi:DNA-binding GntR family transcriptional regulator|nr:GntR family transcriptional regulator [Clostridiaceae bacterium]